MHDPKLENLADVILEWIYDQAKKKEPPIHAMAKISLMSMLKLHISGMEDSRLNLMQAEIDRLYKLQNVVTYITPVNSEEELALSLPGEYVVDLKSPAKALGINYIYISQEDARVIAKEVISKLKADPGMRSIRPAKPSTLYEDA